MTQTHGRYCLQNAVCSVEEEITLHPEVEFVYDQNPPRTDEPAHDRREAQITALALQWLAETTVTCHCEEPVR